MILAGETLPAGFVLDASTGFISGTPTMAGANHFAIQIGGLNYIVHLMVMPATGEILKPNYYDENGPYSVYQEHITVNFAVNELPFNKNTSLDAVLTYPTQAGNPAQVASGKFPIISIMHGSGYQGGDYTQMSKILSSHGFIVIAPTITTYGSYYSIWNDWQIIQRRGYETILNMDLNSASKFYGHANREAIGLMGHSWGGATTELNMFKSPARAFVFIDDISLMNNVKDWNRYFNCFSEPDPFPEKASMILKGGPSNYSESCIEFEGAFTGPRFMATFNYAEHENFLNVGFNGGPDLQKLYTDSSVSSATNRYSAHQLVAFFKRYLLDDVGAGANLYAPFALTQAGDVSPLGGSMAAFRPDWAGQLIIDDFAKSSIATNNLGLAQTSTVNASIAMPYIAASEAQLTTYNSEAVTLINRAQYRHLHIEQIAGAAPGVFVENLGNISMPLDVSAYSHFAFEIAQKDNSFANTLPITIELMDVSGNKFEMPITSSLPVNGFKSKFSHSVLLPLNSFTSVNLSKLITVTIKVGVPSQNIFVEFDNLRFEKIPTVINLPPTVKDQIITTTINQSKAITLSATDKNGDATFFVISTQPLHGSVSIAGTSLTYTPAFNYEGYDQIKYQANDGNLFSNAGVIEITVNGSTPRPIANSQIINANDLNDIPITLTGSDVNNNPLTYTFLSMPAHASIYGTLPNLIMQTYPGFHNATETFTFKVNSGQLDSNVATVTVNFAPINHTPETYNVSATTSKNRAKNIKLNSNDADNNTLTYSVSIPAHGTLSGVAPNLVYTPVLNYSGTDSFTYSVNDGIISSNISTVSVTINSLNSTPYGSSETINAVSGFPVYLVPFFGDSESDPLTFSLVSNAQHGVNSAPYPVSYLYGITYTPDASFVGTDTIVFKCNDGLIDSANATLTLNVKKPQLAPTINNQTLNSVGGVGLAVTFSAVDPNNDPIYYETVSQPAHGVLTGTPPNVIYTSFVNYSGPDGFLFKASDGRISSIGRISINVTAAPDTTAPSIPTGLLASSVTQTSLILSWSASNDAVGVTGYKVYKGGVFLSNSATTNFAVTGLTANTNYLFTVSAYDAAGNNSAVSSALSVNTLVSPDITAPTIPTGLVASAVTQATLTLSWSASSDAVGVTGYKVYKGGAFLSNSATTNFAVTGLTANTNYLFTVSAYDAAGNNSAVSDPISVTTISSSDITPPTAPYIKGASGISGSSATISWVASTDNIGVTGYKIFKNASQIGISATTSFTATGLTPSTNYSFTVSAYDAAGNNSVISNEIIIATTAGPDITPPSVPTGLAANVITQTTLTLSWSASTDNIGVSGYKVFKDGVKIGWSPTTNYNVTGLSGNTTYSFAISAYDNAANTSATTTPLLVTTLASPDVTAPTTPTGLSGISVKQTSLTLSWSASSDAVGVTGYKIFKGGVFLSNSVTTSLNVTGLTANTNYSFTVSAFDAAGNNSATSSALTVTTLASSDNTPPSAPNINSAFGINSSGFSIAWLASTDNVGVTGYKIFKDGVQIGTSIATNFALSGLTAGTSYAITVSAFDAAGNNSSLSKPFIQNTTPARFNISVTAGPNGTIAPEGYFTVYQGSNKTFKVTPDAGYQIDTLLINDLIMGKMSTFSIYNISSNYVISVTFKPLTTAITTVASLKSSIMPTGSVDMNYGGSQNITLAPSTSFTVEKTLVDGVDMYEFDQANFSAVDIVLAQKTLLKTNKTETASIELLDVYREECAEPLTIKFEVSILNQMDGTLKLLNAGEIIWSKGDLEKKTIKGFEDSDYVEPYELVFVKIVSVSNRDAGNSELTNGASNIDSKANSAGSSGGCSYSQEMTTADQLGNILVYLAFLLFFVFKKSKIKLRNKIN